MNALQIGTLLIVLAGAFGAVNHIVLRLPSAIGILIVALAASLGVLGLEALRPDLGVAMEMRRFVIDAEFSRTLLEGMLGLLLFAGALHVRVEDLRKQAWTIAVMATLGVALSVTIVGFGFHWVTGMPFLAALVFGALISPTDPVAVLGVMAEAKLPKSLEAKIVGESLFNDGVGYVVFLVLVGLAFQPVGGHAAGDTMGIILFFLKEVGGGALVGGVLGFLTYRIMRRIDDYPLEILLSLGLALGGYQLAVALDLSGPILAVVAGLFIGDIGVKHGMSEETRTHLNGFWTVIDEILNAVLFLLIGVEVLVVTLNFDTISAGIAAIGLSLVGRLVAVALPVLLIKPFREYSRGVIPIMTWGGLKGGISVALALSLPESDWKPLILTATFIVVVFSIIVQGLTIAPLARRLRMDPDPL
ncbi:sodium:proton antiporter [Rhodovulum sulfidophilum]|uniref:Sodium:proton antiporter n=1 Tax=Rhodovulum visakhapatnamense TaxID=364297 RepID=A0ABS1RJ15_9RHOB|nr:sodium:proton antiporter [Rhodovulum visakhapatnamense]MBL3571400.1 sodium:proton antiporter [Rhodovulum visakhapatnamense]MBL3579598.1 sodium:proton antiporter [Rhodovulum visakhapatnamense]OLS45365.1 sodium:proton antiporter [Rhodovulum sulfidophilum]